MPAWLPFSPWKPEQTQAIAYSTTAVKSAAVGSQTRGVMLTATTNAHILIGPSPVATATNCFLVAGFPYVFGISPGDEVSVIEDAAAGTLYVTELTH